MIDRAVRRRRRALFLFFFLNGIAMSSWVTRTPDIRDHLGVSTGQMGLVLFGLSVGSMAGILCSGRFVSKFGTRPVTALAALLVIASVVIVGVGSASPPHRWSHAGLCVFGTGIGSGEVAINVDGADVERITGTAVLPTLHGCFSLGTVIGGLAGMAATRRVVPRPLAPGCSRRGGDRALHLRHRCRPRPDRNPHRTACFGHRAAFEGRGCGGTVGSC